VIQSNSTSRTAPRRRLRNGIGTAMKDNELVFDQAGDNYFLSQIVDADKGTAAEVFNPDYMGKQDAAEHPTERKHVFAFLRAL